MLTLDLLFFTITLHAFNFTQIMMEGFSCVISTICYVNVWKFTTHNRICDRACENRPCERKLHRVIFPLISFVLNALSHFRKLQKKPMKFCSSDENFVSVV